MLKKTPRKGRFFYGAGIEGGFVLLFAAWMMPLHIPPWLSWHSEILAFASALVMSTTLIYRGGITAGGAIPLPVITWPLGLLCFVVALQFVTGQIAFMGDAFVLCFYIFLSVLGLALGYAVARMKEEESGKTFGLINQCAALLVLGGCFSVIVALVQTLDIWESASWIARMHDARRPGGNIGQPNQLATLILLALASAVYLFETQRLRSITASLIAAILLLGLALTESRSGLLSLGVLTTWWLLKRRRLGLGLSAYVLTAWLTFFALCFVAWPSISSFLFAGGGDTAVAHVNTSAGTRLIVWPQLWEAAWMRPWLGWGLGGVSAAQNAVIHAHASGEAFTYAHNIVLDLMVGVGLPLSILLTVVTAVWLWRRVTAVKDLTSWYGISVGLVFGVHSLLEFPFAYAYLLLPVMFLLGVQEARQGTADIVWIPRWIAATVLGLVGTLMIWSVIEYINIEEDFRVLRFEAMRMGTTPQDYERPKVILLTQLDALLKAGRIVPAPGMDPQQIELARKVALRFPWPATQNRYALSLALNGNKEEALRQMQVIRALHGKKHYESVRANWVELAREKYPQLKDVQLP